MHYIIDYGLGNLRSLQTSLERAGIITEITRDPAKIEQAEMLVLPGVGAYRDAIGALDSLGLSDLVRAHAAKGGILVGICLGMQLLYDKSYEYGVYDGLGIIPGEIVKLEKEKKVPHMGWNNLSVVKDDPLLKYIAEGDYVYFVHSYYAKSEGSEILATALYGETIPAIVRKGNVIGFQFHPEKSSSVGANLLKALGEIL